MFRVEAYVETYVCANTVGTDVRVHTAQSCSYGVVIIAWTGG